MQMNVLENVDAIQLSNWKITEVNEIMHKDQIVKPKVNDVHFVNGNYGIGEPDVVFNIDSIKGGTFAK